MTRTDRTLALANLYAAAEIEMGAVIAAMEAGNQSEALQGMRRVTAVMNEITEAWSSGPTLPLLRLH